MIKLKRHCLLMTLGSGAPTLTKDHRIQTSNRNQRDRSLLRPLGPHPQQKEDLLHSILRSRPPCELLPNLQPQPSTGWHLATPRSSPNLLRSNPRSEAHLPQTPRKDRNKNGQKPYLFKRIKGMKIISIEINSVLF